MSKCRTHLWVRYFSESVGKKIIFIIQFSSVRATCLGRTLTNLTTKRKHITMRPYTLHSPYVMTYNTYIAYQSRFSNVHAICVQNSKHEIIKKRTRPRNGNEWSQSREVKDSSGNWRRFTKCSRTSSAPHEHREKLKYFLVTYIRMMIWKVRGMLKEKWAQHTS